MAYKILPNLVTLDVGGEMVSKLAFNSDNTSSKPAYVCNFSVNLMLKRTKINKKRPGLAH